MPTARKRYKDAAGVERVSRIEDLPDESIQCYARGHRWDDGPAIHAPGWGDLNAAQIAATCDCTRRKTEVIDADTGERLGQAQYAGGVMLMAGSDFPKHLARVEWLRRLREKGAGVTRLGPRRVS